MNEVAGIHKRQGLQKHLGLRSWDERIAQHMKAHELPLVAKEKILGHEVYIGVSDEKLWDSTEYESGYYKTAYAIMRGKTVPIQILEFDGNHNDDMTDQARLQARLNKTIKEAICSIELGIEGGLYEK